MTEQQEPIQRQPRGVSPRAIVVVVLLIGLTAFCIGNRAPVTVWPFQYPLPLYAVIAIAFLIGICIGWLVRGSLIGRARARDGA